MRLPWLSALDNQGSFFRDIWEKVMDKKILLCFCLVLCGSMHGMESDAPLVELVSTPDNEDSSPRTNGQGVRGSDVLMKAKIISGDALERPIELSERHFRSARPIPTVVVGQEVGQESERNSNAAPVVGTVLRSYRLS